MKNLLSSIFILTLTLNLFAQKDVPVKPWLDVSTKEAFKQGDDGTLQLYIKIKGSDYEACKVKAEKAAIYIAIFEGYDANVSANIPKTMPLAKESIYDQNLPYFDAFFADGGKYKSYVSKCDKHPNLLAEMKIDKKTVEANLIVTIRKGLLEQRLLDDKIIQPLVSNEVPPATVLVVPDDSYLDKGNYSKTIDAGGYPTTVYDLVNGSKNEGIETAINTIAAALTGEGKGLMKIEIADAQSALEVADAVNEMSSGSTARKLSPSEVLNNKANWDYTIKLNVKEEVSGTARNLTIEMKIVDMYTLTSETAKPITMVLSSSGNKNQQIERVLNGAIDELRTKIATSYKKKVDVGLEGKVNYYISSNSKGNFNTSVTLANGTSAKMGDVVLQVIRKLSDTKSPPQIDGTGTDLTRSFKNVIIPFETIIKDLDGVDMKIKNTFTDLGTQIESKLKSYYPSITVTTVPRRGTLDVYLKF